MNLLYSSYLAKHIKVAAAQKPPVSDNWK